MNGDVPTRAHERLLAWISEPVPTPRAYIYIAWIATTILVLNAIGLWISWLT